MRERRAPTDVLDEKTVSHYGLLYQGELVREWNPFRFSWNPKKLGDIVGIHRDMATVDCGVKGVILIVLSKDIRVEDSDLLILDRSLEIEEWEPPMSTHLLMYLYGAKHLHVHVSLHNELVLREDGLE